MKLAQMFDMNGRVVFVSGGAGLLGSQISEALAEFGATVLIASRNKDNCVALASKLSDEYGVEAHGYQVDLMDSGSIKELAAEFETNFGGLDSLVNCSGFGKKNTWESISEEDWLQDIDVSLNGVFRMTQAMVPLLKERKGNIVNIASMYGVIAPDHRMYDGEKYANPPSYNAAKGGVLQLTRYLASFLSPHGIRVNAISPGPFPYESTQKENPEFIERLGAKNPMGRIGTPHEMKGAALFLCSEASSYVTGHNIAVDGGWTIW